MIEILLLALSVCGILAAPGVPHLEQDYRIEDNRAEMVPFYVPGAQNLEEKALPISKLFMRPPESLPGSGNLGERIQVRSELPGTRNLAEKRIPQDVLLKLAKEGNSNERS